MPRRSNIIPGTSAFHHRHRLMISIAPYDPCSVPVPIKSAHQPRVCSLKSKHHGWGGGGEGRQSLVKTQEGHSLLLGATQHMISIDTRWRCPCQRQKRVQGAAGQACWASPYRYMHAKK